MTKYIRKSLSYTPEKPKEPLNRRASMRRNASYRCDADEQFEKGDDRTRRPCATD